MGMGIDMVVSIFLLRGDFLVEKMLDQCSRMWNFTMASDIGLHLVPWFTVSSGQD